MGRAAPARPSPNRLSAAAPPAMSRAMSENVAERIYCAVDTTDLGHALVLGRHLIGCVGGLKLGLEFFCAHGPAGVRAIRDLGLPVFLDLKLHDIPNTVAGAMRAAAALEPAIITVHGSGGAAMLKAAQDAAQTVSPAKIPPRVVAITVLTSLAEEDLTAIGQHAVVPDQVARLARLARDSGLAGVVSSAREVAMLRAALGPDALLIVPGLRPRWAEAGDQKRIVTPSDAVRLGADILVIGRPITQHPDPAAAARRIADEIARDLAAAAVNPVHEVRQ